MIMTNGIYNQRIRNMVTTEWLATSKLLQFDARETQKIKSI